MNTFPTEGQNSSTEGKFYSVYLAVLMQNEYGKMICYKQLGTRQRESARFSDAIMNHQQGLDDKMLIAWAAQSVRENVYLDGGDSKYSPGAAADARAVLAGTYNWSITDGGEADLSAVNATLADNIDVYPNPFRDRIQLSNAQEAHRAVMITIDGKVLLDVPLNRGSKQTIDTNLPSAGNSQRSMLRPLGEP